MLDIIKLNLPKINFSGNNLKRKTKGSWGALFLGILFSLAFCPTSGIFYFGMLMPMSAAETGWLSFASGLCDCNRITCYPRSLGIGI